MKALQSILFVIKFFLSQVLNFVFKYFVLVIMSFVASIIDLDVEEKMLMYFILVIFILIMYSFLLIINRKKKFVWMHNILEINNKNKLLFLLFISGLYLLVVSGWIILLGPLFFYFLLKRFFSNINFVNQFYLDFKSVRTIFLIFLILESPILYCLVSTFFTPAEPYEGFFWIFYYLVSNVFFYFPILIFIYWQNKKVAKIRIGNSNSLNKRRS